MTTAAADTVALPAGRRGLRDFSDRLSPMLVKELRQGLKSPVFTWGLIVMQAALAVMAMVAMDEGNTQDVNAAFWWPVAGIVCILLPMRVANALRDEMGGNTMDTLVLTRLSAWRITLGKWLATGALQVLIAITALPYLIMRYFAGGVNMPLEVAWLGVYVLFGLVTTAVMLGLSWFRYFLVRAIIMLGVLAGAVGFCAGTIDEISRTRYELDDIYREVGGAGTGCLLLIIVWAAFFFLDIGAAQIAPVSENRSTRRRLVALATIVAGGGCLLLTDPPDPDAAPAMSGMLLMAMVLPCVQALCERPAPFAPVLRPFVKRGCLGRLAGRLLYPGWHTGLFFTLFLIGTASGLFLFLLGSMLLQPGSFDFGSRELENVLITLTAFGGGIGAMIFPVVVWRLFRKMEQWNFWRWLLVMLCTGLVHMTVMLVALKTSPRVAMANYVLPSGGMLAAAGAGMQVQEEWRDRSSPDGNVRVRDHRNDYILFWEQRRMREQEILIGHSFVCLFSLAAWLTIAIWLALRELRETRRAEDELAAESGAGFPSG